MGRTRGERILRAVEGDVWALHLPKIEQLVEILITKAETGQIPTAQDIEAAEQVQRSAVKTSGAVAVIPLFGTVSRRMGMLDAMSGGCSIETFCQSFRQAMADPQVSSILVQVHSPGGSVYGVEECARMIMDARRQKRVVAIADNLMASAAYYISSAAGELVATPSAEAGSIGVYTVHFDLSAALEAEGIKATIIKAGERKAEGNPYEPLDDDAGAHIQTIVDAYYNQFIRSVAKGRGVPVATVREQFGQGRTFTSERLLSLGMVDRVATFEETVEDLARGRKMPASSAALLVPTELAASSTSGALLSLTAPAAAERVPSIDQIQRALVTFGAALFRPDTEAVTEPEPTVARGHAAPEHSSAPTEPAPQAREESMSASGQAAPTAGLSEKDREAAMEQARAEERERVRQIRGICDAHKMDAAKADGWIATGTAVADVRGEVLEVLRVRQAAAAAVRVGQDRETERPFASLGEQLLAIRRAEMPGPGRFVDPRLLALNEEFERQAAASGANTAVPSEGGFLVQQDLAAGILERMYDIGQLSSRVTRLPVGPNSNGTKIRAMDESSRADGSRWGGVQVYWEAEADTTTATKPKWRNMELNLQKLFGLMYATEEMLEDAPVLGAVAERVFPQEINFKVEDAIFRGTGAGQPLGFLNSPCKVKVSKEGSQAAATIKTENVLKMFGRLWARSKQNAVWFINQDTEQQLYQLVLGSGTAVVLLYQAPGTAVNPGEFGRLLGRPVIPVEYCPTLGTEGDIVLADLAEYVMIDKGGVKQSWSVHVRFIYDEQTFKITYRCDGQPAWNKALTPFQGTATQSPFITLETRS